MSIAVPGPAQVRPLVLSATGSRDLLSRALFACVLVGVPASSWNAVRINKVMTIGDAFIAIAAALALVLWLRRGHSRGVVPAWLPLSAGALAFAGILATYRGGFGGNVVPVLQFVGTLLVLPLIMVTALTTWRRVELAAEAWLLFVAVSCLAAIADFVLSLGISRSLTGLDYLRYTHRVTGLTVHPNHLGLTAAMALPVALAWAARGSRGDVGAFSVRHSAYVVILLGGIMVSGSRAAVIGAVAGLILAPAMAGRGRRSPVAVALVVAMFAAIGVVTLNPSTADRLGLVVGPRLLGADPSGAGSDQERAAVQRSAIDSTLANPLVGTGFGVVRDAHDIFLQLLQAGGIFALLAMGVFWAGSVGEARWLARQANLPPPVRDLPAGLGASLMIWVILAFAENALYDRYLYIPIGLLLAVRALTVRSSTRLERAALPAL